MFHGVDVRAECCCFLSGCDSSCPAARRDAPAAAVRSSNRLCQNKRSVVLELLFAAAWPYKAAGAKMPWCFIDCE